MKKISSLLLCMALLLTLSLPALAQDTAKALTLSGTVVSGTSVSVTAPFGGTVEDFSVKAGDVIAQGDTLFTLSTTAVYAPCEGTIGGLRAQAGDAASYVQTQYGALMYIEPTSPYEISTSTAESYNSNESKLVHVGETVYLLSTNASSRTGVGFITSVSGTQYTVEVTGGNLRVAERVQIYRDSEHTNTLRIGAGKTARLDPVAITAEGSVLTLHVQEGQHVQRGDLLAEMVAGVLPGYTSSPATVSAPESGIIADIHVSAGTAAAANQVMASIHPITGLQIAASVNELDLEQVQVGDLVSIELIGLKDHALFPGTVLAISSLSSTSTGDAEYAATIQFTADSQVREGMSATVYLGE